MMQLTLPEEKMEEREDYVLKKAVTVEITYST
jgi:hypothetical protein